MVNFETASSTQAYRRRCEDRVAIIEAGDSLLIAVADGAGGSGAGEQAAEAVIREIVAAAAQACDAEACAALLLQIDCRVAEGESTGVVVAVSEKGLYGASVGDSQAWLIRDGELTNLTQNQRRKPLLGSGESEPVGFSGASLDGVLLVTTDGFANYVKRTELLRQLPFIEFVELPRRLIEMVRLPSGEFWDDVGIVACRRRPRLQVRKRYEIS